MLLPDKSVVTVTQAKNVLAHQVYQAVVEKINIPPETAKCFALFEIVEYNFGECLYVQVVLKVLFVSVIFMLLITFGYTQAPVINGWIF